MVRHIRTFKSDLLTTIVAYSAVESIKDSKIFQKFKNKISGLTNYLSGVSPIEDIIYETDIQHLNVIPAGQVPPNPTGLLQNKNFNIMIEVFREYYDYVIIDTPPVGQVIDAAIVAPKTDGVVMVVEANRVKKKVLEKAKVVLASKTATKEEVDEQVKTVQALSTVVTEAKAHASEKKLEEKKEKVYNVSTHKKTPVRSEIDLRGKMVDEGIYELETYLDRATLNGYTEVYVIHGKGTGALREGILKYLKTSKYVKEYRIGGHGEGGLGCTVVTLK